MKTMRSTIRSRFVQVSVCGSLATSLSTLSTVALLLAAAPPASAQRNNVILFVGDGMGVSTVTSTRIATVGVDGQLAMDRMPYTAISRTASADYITPDSAATMSAMMTGVNTNTGVIGYGPTTEYADFNGNGDGARLTNIGELAISMGYAVGIVTTTRVTHATPAAVFAHVNDRNLENEIAAQMVPGGGGYNQRLGDGLHVIFGGGRRHFLPTSATGDEGSPGSRSDGRDLRNELQQRGYRYVWNRQGLNSLGGSGRAIGLFASSHLEYEADRDSGQPSLEEMTRKAIQILSRYRKAVLPDGRRRANRPCPPRGECLSGLHRHPNVRSRDQRRAAERQPQPDADPRDGRPQPRLHDRRLPDATARRPALHAPLGARVVPRPAAQRHPGDGPRHRHRRHDLGERRTRAAFPTPSWATPTDPDIAAARASIRTATGRPATAAPFLRAPATRRTARRRRSRCSWRRTPAKT